ncbi:MAG: ABC transporter ATP-binding protein [Clostridia bacterium]|nr:ABC transporter ATP-binding protein [Clostridia bacterium]
MLESRELTKKFGSVTAVDHVSLCLEKGHIYGMLGPNGSGKTTWMKMAAGLIKPTEGSVWYDGEPVNLKSRAEIAYASTEPYFYSWMTVRDAGKYYADFFADFSADEYNRLLARMELDPKAKITGLSSGMTAKMKIAVNLARDAKIYMLDEPFNGIDLLARDDIREAVLNVAGPDKMLLISSHLVEELEAIVDKAVFISKGKLIEVKDISAMQENEGLSLADRYRQVFGHAGQD